MNKESSPTEKSSKAFRYKRPKEQYKFCYSCNCLLTDENWSKSQQGYRRFICMPCWAARQKRYASKHSREFILARQATYRAKQKHWSPERKLQERRRRYNNWLKRNYGITIADYDKLLQQQGHKCSICKTEKPRGRGAFHVDHCHRTGRVRSLLCSECNMMLGLAKDDASRLQSAIDYLTFHLNNHKHEARRIAGGKQF